MGEISDQLDKEIAALDAIVKQRFFLRVPGNGLSTRSIFGIANVDGVASADMTLLNQQLDAIWKGVLALKDALKELEDKK